MRTQTINIQETKTQRSTPVELVAAPLVDAGLHPLGGLRHKANIKLDLKKDFEQEINEMFGS